MLSTLKEALEAAKIKVSEYKPTKQRSVITNLGAMDAKKFSDALRDRLGPGIINFPDIVKAIYDPTYMSDLLADLVPPEDSSGGGIIPDELKDYRLNLDVTARSKDDKFFLTTPGEHKSRMSGDTYLKRCGINDKVAYDTARPVIPEYRPRSLPGVESVVNRQTKENEQFFNSYVPAEWSVWKKDNPKKWRKLPAKPPVLLMKLLKHLIPCAEERRYLYAWIYASITSRSYVYLMLCGVGGSGKNRMKLVLRGLHGRGNYTDGKKSTITEKFNSQLSDNTLVWFDELKHDLDMENVMKEIQNDYLSIERKGIDATGSSTIYSSMVISNNKPRDNFLAFDARKFAPLVLGNRDLRHSMTEKEIELLSNKVDPEKPDFDQVFVAQIAKWILTIGARNLAKYPTLEYRGPMFWTLAHTSMTRWQKRALTALVDKKTGARIGWDVNENAHLWSKVEEKLTKRSNDQSTTFPDYSSVKAFFDIFRDGEGKKAFDTKLVLGNNILGDFWIFPLLSSEIEIITENTIAQQREKGRLNGEKEIFDL